MSVCIAVDEGTSSARAVAFNPALHPLSLSQHEFVTHTPRSGWVEQDAVQIWETQKRALAEVLAAVGAGNVSAIGITNQRETTVLWDKRSGLPIGPAIVWQDRRTTDICEALLQQGHAALVKERTGLVIDPYFSATKIAWLLDNTEGARALAERGEILFGTIDSWLIWNMTKGESHVTDPTNASRTMLYNIRSGAWDQELLSLFRIPAAILPRVARSDEVVGHYEGIPIAAILGDQQAALFGQACFEEGQSKITYGTGCFALMNTGSSGTISKSKLLTTVAWAGAEGTVFAVEGSVFIGGAIVKWLRDKLKIIRSSPEVETLAASVPDAGGVFFVPAFAGLGAPHWDPEAKAAIVGMGLETTDAHIARAALEGLAFSVGEVVRAMEADSGVPIREIRVDGGASQNNLLMQIQADLLGVPVVRAANTESTALGAAALAGISVGAWSASDFRGAWKSEREFHPSISADEREQRFALWTEAVNRVRGF